MSCTADGIVTLVILSQFMNACFPMCMTGKPQRVDGIVTATAPGVGTSALSPPFSIVASLLLLTEKYHL